MRVDEPAQIDVGQDVTGDDEEGVVELCGRVANRSRGTEGQLLRRVAHPDAEVRAVSEVVTDLVGEVRDRDDNIVEAVAREQRDDVLHHRTVHERHHRLGLIAREWTEPGPLTTGEDHRLHAGTSVSGAPPSARPARSA